MPLRLWPLIVVLVWTTNALAEELVWPVRLTLQPDYETVYGLPLPPTEADMINEGGVRLDLRVVYATDHVYRGLDLSDTGGPEDAPNLQFNGRVLWDLGKIPHPFVGCFVNVYDSDPISRFQEIRPYFGLEWIIRPFILEGGHTTYIYPNRDNQNTTEVYGKLTLMDDVLLRRAEPIFSPYVYAAYDYDKYNGWYLEAGVSHDFVIEKTGLTITASALVAYTNGIELFAGPRGKDVGFQRYEVGLTAKYSLNTLLNVSKRYGEWSIVGYGYYADGLGDKVRTDNEVWGGGGIQFSY